MNFNIATVVWGDILSEDVTSGVLPAVDLHGRITALLQVWVLLTDIAGTFPALSGRTSLIGHSRLFRLGWGLYPGSAPFPYGATLPIPRSILAVAAHCISLVMWVQMISVVTTARHSLDRPN